MKKPQEFYFVYKTGSSNGADWIELHSTWETLSGAQDCVNLLKEEFERHLPDHEKLHETCVQWRESLPPTTDGEYTYVKDDEEITGTAADMFLYTHPSVSEDQLLEMNYALYEFGCWEIRKITMGLNAQDDLVEQVFPHVSICHMDRQIPDECQESLAIRDLFGAQNMCS